MGRKIRQNGDTYDPDALRLLGRAIDAAWRDVCSVEAATEAEDRRTRLALIILAIGHEGAPDEVDIKETAVHIMNTEELPYCNAVGH